MGSEETVKVDVVIDPNTVTVQCSSTFTADELCILLCKKYGIPPLIRTLFALRIKGSEYYLKDNSRVLQSSREYELRIRFKVPKLEHLKTLDEKTFDYYFQQARNDVYFNKVPEIIYPEHRREIFGLGITDMYRAVLEEKLSINEVKKNFKKHIPKLIMKRHGPFARKQVYDTLPNMCAKNLDCGYVKTAYIQQLNLLAPNYLSEEFTNVIWKNGEESINVRLHVAPFHKEQPGIRLYNINKGEWSMISTIEELVYFIRNADNSLEISRRGTPLFFQFASEEQLSSFISVCDGYYRLMIKWTFNLSKDDETPSLKELQRLKCHGPVGGAFSYRKLEEKRGKKHGCYIIRQCQDEYNIYFIDVCTINNTTETYRLEFKGNCYILNNEKYLGIDNIVSCHQHPEGRIYLNECLPPSEYDKSQLLLCGEPQKIGFRIDQSELQDILKDNKSPRCLSGKDIILYARPWCYVESRTEDNVFIKQYCTVPFCDNRDCELFVKETDNYSHFISFNQTFPNMSFAVRLWDPDFETDGLVRLLLSVVSVPASKDDILRWGTGIELTISKNETSITIGNKESFSEPTEGILKSTEYTNFTLSWDKRMLILGLKDKMKPIYMNEIDAFEDDENLEFLYYSLSGVNAIWELPFCDDDDVCEEHVTFYPRPSLLWHLRRVQMNYELELSLRSYHSAIVYFMCDPYNDYPRIIIKISFNNETEVIYELSNKSRPLVLGKASPMDFISYWKWTELHFSLYSQEMHIIHNDDGHFITILKVKHDLIGSLTWFSVGANYSISHWTFYCDPPPLANAYPPECGLGTKDLGYTGTQWVTSSGLPCIPWADDDYVPRDIRKNEMLTSLKNTKNYCRNINDRATGPWCFVLFGNTVKEEACHVRRCDAMDCKVAGTANDYAGKLDMTRSKRICKKWTESLKKSPQLNNGSLYPEGTVTDAQNYCRNPSRSLAGAWCFTEDKNLERDLCEVRDCAKGEPNIVLTKHGGELRYIYILPEWKFSGKDGGLHFSLKEWNPDLLDGILFKVFSPDKLKSYTLYIGAEHNEKVNLRFSDERKKSDSLLVEKSLPHLIPIGKWGSFWLQMLKGGLRIGFQKRDSSFFEWITNEEKYIFEPSFMSYQSLEGNVIGVHFPERQCHTENTTTLKHTRIYPISIWEPEDNKDYSNLTLHIRGTGVAIIPLLDFPGSMRVGSGGITATHKAHWKLDQTRKLEVAYKTLQDNRVNGHLKDFIELASKWACVQSSSIVRLYGITLNSPTAMVLEYLPYGPFDDFLRVKEKTITILHLKKVAASLTRALWDLSEAGIVHGYIRCRRLLVALADSERIVVKLSGPSLHQYTSKDVHWMPVEFMSDMSLAKRSVAGDIWAFATTLWEIFSFGQKPTETNPIRTAKSYEMGERLHKPERCPSEIWSLVRQSWQHDPHMRPRPQELMRDINHMLHSEYLPVHIYEEPKISLNTMDHDESVSSAMFLPSELSDAGSNKSLISSVDSSIPSMNGTVSDQYDNHIFTDRLGSNESLSAFICSRSPSSRMLLPAGASPRPSSPTDHDEFHKPRLMENIVSQGKTYNVTLTDFKLGCGYYGRVFRGIMESESQVTERRDVAVKILSRSPDNTESFYDDFKNELEIMKSLQHANIIEILGYSVDEHHYDVRIYMEYMEQGSLNNYLKFNKQLTISHLLKYCFDIAMGMDHIAAKNIIHRDLATRNILVLNQNHVKITDFGLARVMPKEEDAYKVRSRNKALPINWSAPEAAVKPFHFSTKSDVWSYGVTVWEIFTRSQVDVPPFDIDRPAERASIFRIPDECPSEVYRYLMKDCWEFVPAKRPTFIDLVHKCKGIISDYK